jgi:hypothetical protein
MTWRTTRALLGANTNAQRGKSGMLILETMAKRCQVLGNEQTRKRPQGTARLISTLAQARLYVDAFDLHSRIGGRRSQLDHLRAGFDSQLCQTPMMGEEKHLRAFCQLAYDLQRR